MSDSSSTPGPVLYVFAAKGLQGFVLGSDELRDMVGASEVIDRLPHSILETLLSRLAIASAPGYKIISQAAGSARIEFGSRADAEMLAAVWPMTCALAAPGLEVVQTIVPLTGDYIQAVNRAEKNLALERNQPRAYLPEITPAVARNPRSGLPAHRLERDRDDSSRLVPVDFEGAVKRRARDEARRKYKGSGKPGGVPAIYEAFGFSDWDEIPEFFEQIAREEREYLAVVHADGNGMGAMFMKLQQAIPDEHRSTASHFYRELSAGIVEAGKDAARRASDAVKPHFGERTRWPLLPIVLAGDDLTVVIRADLAIDFTKAFLEGFAAATKRRFDGLKNRFREHGRGLPNGLSAGAGICYVKPRFPFSVSYALCESLAAFAKKKAKAVAEDGEMIPSTLAFHRVTASATPENFSVLLETELKGALRGGHVIRLSMAPYKVDAGSPTNRFASLDELVELAELLVKLPSGQARELLTLLETDTGRAEKHFERFVRNQNKAAEVMGEPAVKGSDLENALKALTRSSTQPLFTSDHRTPFQDALVLAGFLRQRERLAVSRKETERPPAT